MTANLRVYPNTETYLINWPAGASGSFLASLVAYFVNDDFTSTISLNGNSHQGRNVIAENWKLDPETFKRLFTHHPAHLYIEPRYEDKPFILFDHVMPDWDLLLYQFPKVKNIKITVTQNEVVRMFGNLFFKQFVEHYSPGNPTSKYWEQNQEYHPYLKKYPTPDQVELADVRRYLEDTSTYQIPLEWREEYDLPENICDKVYLIRFYDIIHDAEKVLSALSDITGRPINERAIEFYNQYLEKQSELVNSKMPWLNDK